MSRIEYVLIVMNRYSYLYYSLSLDALHATHKDPRDAFRAELLIITTQTATFNDALPNVPRLLMVIIKIRYATLAKITAKLAQIVQIAMNAKMDYICC